MRHFKLTGCRVFGAGNVFQDDELELFGVGNIGVGNDFPAMPV